MGVLGCIVGSIRLYGGSVELYGGECWITWWGIGLYGVVLGYMVWIVGLHCGECWVIWWGVGLHVGDC